MYQLTADQAGEFDPAAFGWKSDALVHLQEFPEVKGRPMVWQRDFYVRGTERLVIEWGRAYTITALALNGRWLKRINWDLLQIMILDRDPRTRVEVTGAPGYADFEGELILAPEFSSSVVVAFMSEGSQNLAVVPRECVKEIGG